METFPKEFGSKSSTDLFKCKQRCLKLFSQWIHTQKSVALHWGNSVAFCQLAHRVYNSMTLCLAIRLWRQITSVHGVSKHCAICQLWACATHQCYETELCKFFTVYVSNKCTQKTFVEIAVKHVHWLININNIHRRLHRFTKIWYKSITLNLN